MPGFLPDLTPEELAARREENYRGDLHWTAWWDEFVLTWHAIGWRVAIADATRDDLKNLLAVVVLRLARLELNESLRLFGGVW